MGIEKEMGLDDKFTFGKYKEAGTQLYIVIEDDTDYITWCLENIEGFLLDNEAFEEYQKQIED